MESQTVKTSLRILVAHNVPRARTGGMSRLMGFIHDYITREGHAVDLFCAEQVPKKWSGRITRLTFPVLVRRHAIQAARAGRPYDIINIHEPSGAAISTFRKAAHAPAVVVTSYGVERRAWELSLEEKRFRRGGPSLKTRLVYPPTILWQSGWSLRNADHILCSNSEDGDYLVRNFGIARQKITRMFSGADPAYAAQVNGRDYASADRLLFAGSWIQRKGIDDLVPAFIALAARYPKLTLTILAADLNEHEVTAAFPEAIRARVFCVSTRSEADNIGAYRAADIYVLPSLFEGTPLTLIEAMMSGMPIVTTATCGMKDVIRNGENGLLVPVHSPEGIISAVERLLDDSQLRRRLGQAAQREALEKYSWDRVAEPILDVYQHLRNRNGSS